MATIRLSEICVTRGRAVAAGGRSRWRRYLPGMQRGFALRNLTLTVPHGQTLALLGPSGCGKSTLLRIIAGLEAPDSGRVLFNGRDVSGIRPGERRIGYLFQSYALYPHFTARQNITSWFHFRRHTPELNRLREALFQRTSELLDVELSYLLERKPPRLSGGEQQRVALGRCITREPELFLLDEPFSNLDAKLRSRYRLHLKTLLREFGITTVYVTHDQQEAELLGDRIGVMRMRSEGPRNEGTLEQVGTVQELYAHPRNRFVADFLNLHPDLPPISFLPGEALDGALAGFTVGVRPEDVAVGDPAPDAAEAAARAWPGVVEDAREDTLRQYRVLTLRVGAGALVARTPLGTRGRPGETLPVRFRHWHLFDADGGEAVHAGAAVRAVLG
jgi:ABC-type sugar transport system ATPase subunit